MLNSVLLYKGYTLIRRERLLTVINLEEAGGQVPDILVEFVPLEELDQRGEYELVKCLFQIEKMKPEEAERDLVKLIGPMGRIFVLPSARQILIQETAGKLRTIRSVIEAVENPLGGRTGDLVEIELKHALAEAVLPIARKLLGLPEGQDTGEGISIAADLLGTRLFVKGTSENVKLLEELVKRLDQDPGLTPGSASPEEQFQLQIHVVTLADPTSVLQVIQTIMAGEEGVRLAIDPKTNNLVALAKPSQHATIKATLGEMQREGEKVFDVIQLRRLEPQTAVLMINNFFGAGAETGDGLKVDGDPVSLKLYLRGTTAEIAKVKDFISTLEGPELASDNSNVRLVPFGGGDPQAAINMAELLWTGGNPIRLVAPSGGGSSFIHEREVTPAESGAGSLRVPPPMPPSARAPLP